MSRAAQQNQKIHEAFASIDNGARRIDEIARIRGWFRPKDGSEWYSAVQDYLNETISLSETASRLFQPIDEKINAARLDDVDFMDLWYSIIHSARRLSCRGNAESHNHDKLVDLIQAFKEHSIPNNEIYNYLYNDMTDFAMACREAYNDAPTAYEGFLDEEVEAWANMNFFFARVTEKGLVDLSLFAIWAMRDALETPPVDDPTSIANQQYDAYVPAAAAWIFGCGRHLFRLEKDLTPTDHRQGNPARGGELWKGRAEFSKERWGLWKERFAAIGKMDGVSEKTRIAARDAVESMERSETYEPMRQ